MHKKWLDIDIHVCILHQPQQQTTKNGETAERIHRWREHSFDGDVVCMSPPHLGTQYDGTNGLMRLRTRKFYSFHDCRIRTPALDSGPYISLGSTCKPYARSWPCASNLTCQISCRERRMCTPVQAPRSHWCLSTAPLLQVIHSIPIYYLLSGKESCVEVMLMTVVELVDAVSLLMLRCEARTIV